MRIFKRFVCAFLALLLLSVFPLTALATPAISLSPTSYVISLLLDACGIQVNTTALSSFVSTVSGYDEYVELGKNKQLGAYSQWIYDNRIAHQEEIEKARADFMDAFGWMIDLGKSTWGEDIKLADGALSRAYAGIKEWLATFPSYGTSELDYSYEKYADHITIDGTTLYPNLGTFNCLDGYTCQVISSSATFSFFQQMSNIPTTYAVCSDKPFVVNIYNSRGNISETYQSTARDNYYFTAKSWYIFGTKDRPLDYEYDTHTSLRYDDIFKKLYKTGVTIPTVSVPLPVGAVKSDLQDKVLAGLGDAISLPADEATAEKKLSGIDFGDSLQSIFKAIADAGIVLNPGIDIPSESESTGESETTGEGEDTETKTTLSAILAKVGAIPAEIGAMLRKMLEPEDTDKDVENMKLPTSIADKFPFCIPFDVIYLVKAMNASSEVPRFELPFKIHYQNINYEHTFVVDMTDWDVAVKILRTMLDLLFIAGLISTTRELIRG